MVPPTRTKKSDQKSKPGYEWDVGLEEESPSNNRAENLPPSAAALRTDIKHRLKKALGSEAWRLYNDVLVGIEKETLGKFEKGKIDPSTASRLIGPLAESPEAQRLHDQLVKLTERRTGLPQYAEATEIAKQVSKEQGPRSGRLRRNDKVAAREKKNSTKANVETSPRIEATEDEDGGQKEVEEEEGREEGQLSDLDFNVETNEYTSDDAGEDDRDDDNVEDDNNDQQHPDTDEGSVFDEADMENDDGKIRRKSPSIERLRGEPIQPKDTGEVSDESSSEASDAGQDSRGQEDAAKAIQSTNPQCTPPRSLEVGKRGSGRRTHGTNPRVQRPGSNHESSGQTVRQPHDPKTGTKRSRPKGKNTQSSRGESDTHISDGESSDLQPESSKRLRKKHAEPGRETYQIRFVDIAHFPVMADPIPFLPLDRIGQSKDKAVLEKQRSWNAHGSLCERYNQNVLALTLRLKEIEAKEEQERTRTNDKNANQDRSEGEDDGGSAEM